MYGSVLFHKGCDLVKALSTALEKNQNKLKCQVSKEVSQPTDQTEDSQSSMEQQLANVSTYLNEKIHQQAKLLLLLFCTNSTCSMPLYVVLTEAILCHRGSLELVRILNRVGAVASLDTNSRLATHIVKERLVQGITPQLVPKVLTVVSTLLKMSCYSSITMCQYWDNWLIY